MVRVRTSDILKELGIDAEVKCYDGVEPELADVRFDDIIPQLRNGPMRAREIASARLYRHQLEAFKALDSGKNIILISGTGSGKTEAWLLYALGRGKKTLVIYPTLALSADQVRRIEEYSRAIHPRSYVVKVDRQVLNHLSTHEIRSRIGNAGILITNPAFLMSDLKRVAAKPAASYLLPFLRNVEFVVIDELDFYGSRGATLLISMVEIIGKYVRQGSLQVAVLTATLGNAGELARMIEKVTSREVVVIEGRPFKIRNCTYLILGKDIELVRSKVLEYCREFNVENWIREVAENPQLFRRYVLDIVDYLRSRGVEVPSPYVDPIELIKYYLMDDYVTVVFTPSIKSAEKLARRLKESVSSELKDLIAVHHHLIPKDVRGDIEERARSKPPKVKVIVTVRTLLQGIDIGNIVRVVHYGLPVEVREFWQREGRKGRRRELGEAETVIIPISSWDRAIASSGLRGVEDYSAIPLEKVYVIADNKYALMFKALFKVVANLPLDDEELRLLEELGLVERSRTLNGEGVELSEEGLEVWRNLNFYEFGPPYGVRRLILVDGGVEAEPISRRDLVERYQSGTIDYSSDAIVVSAERGVLYEIPSSRVGAVRSEYSFIDEALSHYAAIKARWGEKADLITDIARGKVNSIVEVGVRVPKSGFGKYFEKPYVVKWLVESSRRVKMVKLGGSLIPLYDEESIVLDVSTHGTYKDFTYGYYYRVDPAVDPIALRIGAAAIRVLLRLSPKYAVSFRELNISVEQVLPLHTIVIWEPEASGILSILRWEDVMSLLDEFKEPPTLWYPLIKLVDREAASIIASRGIGWDDVLSYARSLVMSIAKLEATDFSGMKLYIPKPSVEQKVMSIEAVSTSGTGGKAIIAVACFDGDEVKVITKAADMSGMKEVDEFIEAALVKALDNDLVVVTSTELSNLVYRRSTRVLLKQLEGEGKVLNPYAELKKVLGVGLVDMEKLGRVLGIRMPEPRATGMSEEDLREYVENYVILTYKTYLLVNSLRHRQTVG